MPTRGFTHHRNWRRVDPRATAEKWNSRWIRLVSIFSSFPRRGYLQKQTKTQQAVDFINDFFTSFVFPIGLSSPSNLLRFFCFFLSDLASPSLLLGFAFFLCFRWWRGQEGTTTRVLLMACDGLRWGGRVKISSPGGSSGGLACC